jgi:hypothetical protein
VKLFYLAPLLLAACQPSNLAPTITDGPDATIKDAGIDVEVVDAAPEAEQVEAAPVAPKHQNILLIGDSQVQYADWFFKPFRKTNETVFFDSKPGTTIGWWSFGIFHREMSKYPNIDVVIVFLGTNNFNFKYLQPYQSILDEIKVRKVKCIWVGPTAVYGKKHVINSLIKDAVSGTCTYVDTEELDIPLVDGVHPTQPGAVKWLTEIWKVKATL